jgi:hypothetical protein
VVLRGVGSPPRKGCFRTNFDKSEVRIPRPWPSPEGGRIRRPKTVAPARPERLQVVKRRCKVQGVWSLRDINDSSAAETRFTYRRNPTRSYHEAQAGRWNHPPLPQGSLPPSASSRASGAVGLRQYSVHRRAPTMSMRLYSVILRGGSNYRPSTSLWYIPNRDPSTDPLTRGPHEPLTTSVHARFDDAYESAGHDWLRSAAGTLPGRGRVTVSFLSFGGYYVVSYQVSYRIRTCILLYHLACMLACILRVSCVYLECILSVS